MVTIFMLVRRTHNCICRQAGIAIRLKEIHIVAAFLLRIYRSDYRQQHQSSNARVTAQIIDSLKGKYWYFTFSISKIFSAHVYDFSDLSSVNDRLKVINGNARIQSQAMRKRDV